MFSFLLFLQQGTYKKRREHEKQKHAEKYRQKETKKDDPTHN
jgi:hypothetical protein